MARWLALLLACVALGLVVAGCGDDDGGGGGATTEEPAGGGGGAAEVVMEATSFNPAKVTVKVGDTVTWTNNDPFAHDVTADEFKSGDPGGMGSDDTFEHTFDQAGTFDYVCTVHAGMEGSVVVE